MPTHLPAFMLLFALLLAGCGAAPQPDPEAREDRGGAVDAGEPADSTGVRPALLAPSPDTDLAALEGFLHVEGRCLYVTGRGGGGKTLPAFSFAVRWDAARNRLLAHGKAFAPGQHVRLGGSSATDRSRLIWAEPPDPSCDRSSIFVTGAIDAVPEPPPRSRG